MDKLVECFQHKAVCRQFLILTSTANEFVAFDKDRSH